MEPRSGARRKIKPRCIVDYTTQDGLESTVTSILNDPEELAIGIALHIYGAQVDRPRVHPAAYIHFPRTVHAMAESALHPEQLVSAPHINLNSSRGRQMC